MNANPKQVGAYDLLVGGGEMGGLIRSKDWANRLGPIEGWPQSLKTVIFLMLNSRYPMFVWWGRELTNFYNDAYIPVLGARHPEALGQPASRVWADIWNVVGPQAEIVMREGRATWNESILLVMERHGYTEETYFTFSYSPATDDDGRVGGVFCACTEDTKRVLGERRLRTLRALAEQATQAKSAEEACAIAAATLRGNSYDLPFAMLYLLDADGAKARRAGATIPDTPASPAVIELGGRVDGGWLLGRVIESGESQVVNDLKAMFGPGLKLAGGAWPEPARQAVVLPLARPGQAAPYGFLVAGISPRLLLDDDYHGFLELTAGHVANAVANARAHEEERKRVEALAQIDRAKTAFFSNVSHEFRTPLTLILGPTEEMLSGALGETNEIQRQHLLTLRHNAVRLQKLVNTLLDYARVEAGRIEATYEPVDIGLLTREIASTFCSAVHRAGLLYVVNCPSMDEPIYIDRDMWEKIVLNLLSNALKFTFTGAIEITLTESDERRVESGETEGGADGGAELSRAQSVAGSRVEREEDSSLATHHLPQMTRSVVLTVRDTGVGIPGEELPHLFDRFHRVHGSRARTQEGSGIGLALVQELVKLNGGSLQVESALDSGTTFTIFIPKGSAHLPQERLSAPRALSSTALGAAPFVEEALRWLPDSDEEVSPLPMGAPESFDVSRPILPSSERILIADDNLDMRSYLKRLLETRWNVTAVEDGAKALEVARLERPDLVLSDVMMPSLDGFELLRELRADAATSTIPVMLLSARAGEEAKVEGLNAGADDYLVKPFTAKELLARVEAHLKLQLVRREAEKALRESEERFRMMADSSPIMNWVTDAAGRTTFLSRTYLEYLGISAGDTAMFDWSEIVHADDRDAYIAAFQTALQERQTFHQRVRLRRFDGQWRWFETRGNPLFDGAGRMTGYIGSSPDITDIYESQQRLKELDQRKDEFLANMSHEIRSPLTGIMGYADILLDRLKNPEDIECLNTIKESGDYLIEIVNDILDLSKIEAGKLVLNIEAVPVHSILAEVQGLMDVRARQKKLPLVLRYESALPESVHTDRTRLRQILINLVSNAIKFTESGRVEIVARFVGDDDLLTSRGARFFQPAGNRRAGMSALQIEVIDTGIGIARDHHGILFQPFTQADSTSTRQYSGTGLGLTITRRLVEMLGGSISFESELGKGSTFCVRIPAGPARDASNASHLESQIGEPFDKVRLRNKRVLAVDDREEICYLVSRYVRDAGGRVDVAGDGEAAIEAVEAAAATDPFDAMILDIHMPGMDGYEVARTLRAKGFQLVIIALTAGAMVGDREKCLQAGCDDYLTKPIDRRKLVQLVDQHAQKAVRTYNPNGSKLKILLVDDSHNACIFLSGFLEKRGHVVRVAYAGGSALPIAQDFRPDVILVDIRLPDMNGYELMQRLKKIDGIDGARFIALSGYHDGDAPGSKEFDHFLEKPLDTARLETLLQSIAR